MDLCHRCQHALSFAEHEYEYERFSDPSASGKLDLTIGHKYASPEEQEIISTEVLREMRQYLDVYPDYPNLKAAADQGCQFCALLRSAMISKETRLDRDRMLEKILPLDVMLRISFFQQERLEIDGNSRAAQWTLKVKVHFSMDPSKFDVIGKPQWNAVIMSIYFPVSVAKNGTTSSGEDQNTMPSLPLLGLNQNALCFIKSSIAECLQRCGHEASAGLRALPSRLIKVEHGLVRLVEIGDISYTGHLPFTTLSYCWGNSPQLKLERDTLNQMQGGIPIKDLAAAHRDAIILTGMLSIPYIWIDALCIFQDDAEDWAQESEKMSGIYASSTLTICAVSSGSSDEGFLDSTLPSVTIPFKDLANDTKTETYEIRGFVIPGSEGGGWPIWDAIPHKNSSWCGRSWTYQEQIFSQRRLYFTSLGLIFNCSNFWYSEATRTKRDPNHPGLEQRPDPQSRNGLYSGWKHMIQDYSPRHITKISDHLPALSGLARQFSRTLQDDYLAGLWRGKLLQGLSWSSSHSSISTLENLVETLEVQVQEGIPTWTWLNRGSVHTAGLCSEMYRASCNVIEASVTPKYADPYGEISGSRLVLEAPVLSLDTSSIINPAAPWWNNVPLGSAHVRITPDWLPEESEALPSTLLLLMLCIIAPPEADYAHVMGIVVYPVGQQDVYCRVGAFFVSFDTPADADEFLVECESCRRTVELI